MPVLKNSKHELFAQSVAKGMSAVRAYVVAGYEKTSAAPNAVRLMENDGVKSRIAELKRRAAGKVEVTIEGLIEDMIGIRDTALTGKVKQLGAASNAVVILAKLAGLWVERRENTNTNATIDPTRMTDAEIIQRLDEIKRERGDELAPAAPVQEPHPDKLH